MNLEATGKQIPRVSRSVVLGFGCLMGILVVMLNKVRVSLGWMYLAMGCFVGSVVLPIAFMLLGRKASAKGAVLGTISGCVLRITTWLTVTKVEYGRVNLDTIVRNAPMLATSSPYSLEERFMGACDFVWPQDYDWETTKQITVVEKEKSEASDEELKEEKLVIAKRWVVIWGNGFTLF